MGEKAVKKRICIVVAAEITVSRVCLADQISMLSCMYDVNVIVNTKDIHFLEPLGVKATVISAPIERKIVFFNDIKALLRLLYVFRKNKFDIVHSITPKAGLLAALAGFISRVPIRIHTFTGQVWVTCGGFERWLLKAMDKLIAMLTTHILVDSFSQRNFLVDQRIIKKNKSTVLAKGSLAGVDTMRYHPHTEVRMQIRLQLGISEDDVIFMYLGRWTRDKGVLDLAQAFAQISNHYPKAHLLMAGFEEEGLKAKMVEMCKTCGDRVHFAGYVSLPEHYLAASDVFCLPSYREGFGIVIIEAAAVGIPSIASRIYGITDSMEENVTGLLHAPGNIDEIAQQMVKLLEDADLRKKMGENARLRVVRDFKKELVTSALINYYNTLLREFP